MRNFKLWFVMAVCIFVILPAIFILYTKLEGENPSVESDLTFSAIGVSQELSFSISDAKSGLRQIQMVLLKNGKEFVLLEKNFSSGGIFGITKVTEDAFKILVEPGKMGITDGKATFLISATDHSWRRWWNGNKTLIEKKVTIDTRPPRIDVLSETHNFAQGGSGLVIYRLSEPCPENGVYVGENFFQGYSGRQVIGNPHISDVFMAFIGLNYKQNPGTNIFVSATDQAGNIAKTRFPYYIKKKNFKTDVINISDGFLTWEMPKFDSGIAKSPQISDLEEFLMINNNLRAANAAKMIEITRNTSGVKYWKGTFLRLPKSARKAGFADHREYKYKEDIIDHQVHLGIDLASIAMSPVPAANSGKVVFVGKIGIYGKTVIIDHGFGLFSTYSHLSSIRVQKDQIISKGDPVGKTGKTGFAFGDHLHFGMIVHNTFVNPIEWWDSHWIRDNISRKIKTAKSNLNNSF
ncbi:M23 family metallopeptidase [Desulfonema magnum]|nr:M23 family metallopeptidase [Desulfonema magnum]